MIKRCLFIFDAATLYSCTYSKDLLLEQALTKAGRNRVELGKVLEHYQNDQRKLEAARFLIENMPYHQCKKSSELSGYIRDLAELSQSIWAEQQDISAYRSATIALDSLKKVPKNIFQLEYETENDIETITSDYLIRQIDLVFDVWDQVPWKERISMEQLCEEILPYRIADEALSDWREVYFQQFSHILDSLPETEDCYLVACRRLYDAIEKEPWFHVDEFIAPWVDALTLLKYRYGSCREKAACMLYAMRALCLPGSIDMILQHPHKMHGFHYWNRIPDINGSPIEFEIHDTTMLPVADPLRPTRKKGIVYRVSYKVDLQKEMFKKEDKLLLERMQSPFLKNVSQEYFPQYPVKINLSGNDELRKKRFFLGVFNNNDWTPVVEGKKTRDMIDFGYLEPEIVYLPICIEDEQVVPQTVPFRFMQNGKPLYFLPDTQQTITMHLTRKHPLPSYLEHLKRFLIGGVFQGSNQDDFSDAVDLYVVKEHNDLQVTKVLFDRQDTFRYVRYLSAPEGFCNMAEMRFYDNNGQVLEGDIIGNEGSYNNHPGRTKQAVFDNNPLSFYEAKEKTGAWVGLDLKKKTLLSGVEFQFRNDDNLIREGELYELFYFIDKGVESLGKQYGTSQQVLIYENVPENALFWLRNYTRGKEERIFTYENGEQIWW